MCRSDGYGGMAFSRLAVFLSLLAASASSAVNFPASVHGRPFGPPQAAAGDCQLPDGALARCVPITECPSGLKALKHRQSLPPRCGFKGRVEIVCCPDLRVTSKKPVLPATSTEHNSIRRRSPIKVGARSAEACQKYSKNAFPRIALFVKNGIEASPGEFPHMALLGYKFDNHLPNSGSTLTKGMNASWSCCGTLIHERFVLTAAHCLEMNIPIVVRLGDLDWNSNEDGAQPKEFQVKRVELHPEFELRPSLKHDIALIELKTQVPFNWGMQPACLPSPGENEDTKDQNLIVTGWGDTEYAALSATSVLMKANLRAIPFKDCIPIFANSIPEGIKEDRQMCAVDPKGLADACRGDSGGPLQARIKDSQLMKVVGVTSAGHGCGTSPGLYTRVSGYIEWIENIVWPTK